MTYEPQLIVKALVYILTLWFFLCCIQKPKIQNIGFYILLSWISINLYWLSDINQPIESSAYLNEYIGKRNFMIKLDGVFALMMSMFLHKDKSAWKHSLLLAFAALCHIMILLNLKTDSYTFFYTWYDELIIIVGLLQMVVSRDGITEALRSIQGLLRWWSSNINRGSKGLSPQKKRSAKT